MADTDATVYPSAIAVPVLASIALLIDVPPLAWHIRNRNLAATSLVGWVMLSNLMNFINALIWPADDTVYWWLGSGLCDVEVKLMIAVSFGFAGSLLCIMRNLAHVLDTKRTILSPSRLQRRKILIFECLLCFGGPLYGIAVHYVVQPSRYYVFAISGCTTSYDNSWPKFVLVLIWPLVICIVVVYYCVLVIMRMRRYRQEFSEILSSSHSNMTKSRFLRLFLLSMTLIAILIPTQVYILYQNARVPLIPYSWSLVHGSTWYQRFLIPTGGTVIFDRWVQIAAGFIIFPFFGLGQDAQKLYRKGLVSVGFGRLFPALRQGPSSSKGSLTSSREGYLSSRARLFFHMKQSQGSSFSLPSHNHSNPLSGATGSPAEMERRFAGLSTISEVEGTVPGSPSSPSYPMLEKPRPSIQSSLNERCLDQLIYTELPASHDNHSVRTSNPAAYQGLGLNPTHELM